MTTRPSPLLRPRSRSFWFGILLLVFPTYADGTSILVEFEGVTDFILDDNLEFGGAPVLTPFVGSFVVDGGAVDTDPNMNQGAYDFSQSPFSRIEVQFAGSTYFLQADQDPIIPLNVSMTNDEVLTDGSTRDLFRIGGTEAIGNFPFSPTFIANQFALSLSATAAPGADPPDLLTSDSLVIPDILSADSTFFEHTVINDLGGSNDSIFRGHLTSLVVIPEPSTAALLGLALAGLAVMRGRHRKA